MDEREEDRYRELLTENPGAPEFVEFAIKLREQGRVEEAILICLAGLSANPDRHQGRLVLARLFYDRRYVPFAVREVEMLTKAFPDSETLNKLLAKLSPGGGAGSAQNSTVSEAEFGFEAIDLLEDRFKKKELE